MTFQPKLSVCHVGKLSLPDYIVLIMDASGSIKENQLRFYCNVVFVSDITHLFRWRALSAFSITPVVTFITIYRVRPSQWDLFSSLLYVTILPLLSGVFFVVRISVLFVSITPLLARSLYLTWMDQPHGLYLLLSIHRRLAYQDWYQRWEVYRYCRCSKPNYAYVFIGQFNFSSHQPWSCYKPTQMHTE